MYVGQTLTFRRTFTYGEVALFCGVTGYYNPYHQDEAFARESFCGPPHRGACSHTSGAYWGSSPPKCPSSTWRRSSGDPVSCTVTNVEKNETRHRVAASAGFVNQDWVEVLRALFSGLPGRIRLAR